MAYCSGVNGTICWWFPGWLGQWYACQLDLGWMYPPERVQIAARALFQYNFPTDFHGVKQVPRKFVADDDPGMQMGASPRGSGPLNLR